MQEKYNISSGLNQLIKQSEIDVVGVRVSLDENEYYAIEVAFHEAGLNYGNNEERIAKKLIRAAFSIYMSTGSKRGNIIFATPSMRKPNETVSICEELNSYFSNQGFEFTFSLYLNEDFYEKIIEPLTLKVKEIKDTSDLFIRALKLNLISESKSLSQVDETDVIDDLDDKVSTEIIEETNYNLSNLNELLSRNNIGIGKRALKFFKVLGSEGVLKRDIVKEKYLGSFPLFMSKDSVSIEKLNNRYYQSNTFSLENEEYLLCNNWYEKDEALLYDIFKIVN